MANPDPEGIKDDLEDIVDISKMIAGVMAGDVATGFDRVTDKAKEIQAALDEALLMGTDVKIETSTFSTMSDLLKDSKLAITGVSSGVNDFSAGLLSATSIADILTSIQEEGTIVTDKQTALQDELNNSLGKSADQVRQIQVELAELKGMSDFLETVEASVGATSNVADAQRVVNDQTQQFLGNQQIALDLVKQTYEHMRDLEDAVGKVNDTTSSVSDSWDSMQPPSALEWDTSAMENASDRIKEIQTAKLDLIYSLIQK